MFLMYVVHSYYMYKAAPKHGCLVHDYASLICTRSHNSGKKHHTNNYMAGTLARVTDYA